MFYLLRLFRRFLLMHALDGEGGVAVVDTPAAPVVEAPVVPAVVEPGATPPAVTGEPAAPKTMLEAISQSIARDEKGRFAPKDPNAPAVPAAPAVAAAPAVPAVPKPATDDLTAMPEGLGPKAQERFQKLATANREVTERADMLDRQVSYVRETFQQHGVRPEQFEQAAGVIGMFNRGDLRGALAALDEQRAQIALALGEPLPGVDALSRHPDLRQAVDSLELTEQRALEIARLRQQTGATQQREQAQQAQQREQAQTETQVRDAQGKVDEFCKRMQSADIDYPAIEAQLLPALPKLMRGIPPSAWAGVVEAQYNLLKQAASAFRRPAPTTVDTNPLRANGAASPRQAPASMHEAMWGTPAPRA